MQYIHLKCLKHWLEVNSQQGRRRALRCEICKAKYRDARGLQADGQLLPSVLHDPYAIASLLHGALRAYVAISGMVQAYNIYRSIKVYWYTALLALTPQPPNADAFAGMALGAAVGGMMAQLVFMPILGSGKLAALGHSCKLLLQCLLRLLAAEACQARGYRVLAAAVRAVMQIRWRLQLRQQLWRVLLSPLVGLGWLIGAGPPDAQVLQAAAGLEVLLQQQQHDAQ
eukprot:gene7648-7851_t